MAEKKQVSVYMNIKLIKQVKQRALDLDKNISEYIEGLVKADLEKAQKNQ